MPSEPRPGYRWVRGLFVVDRNLTTGEEGRVPDVCCLCFARKHSPSDCDNPRVTEWFEISDVLVD